MNRNAVVLLSLPQCVDYQDRIRREPLALVIIL